MTADQTTDDGDCRIDQNALAELIDEYTRENGGFTAEELVAARIALYGTEGQDAGR